MFEAMQQEGIMPDTATYKALMRGFAATGQKNLGPVAAAGFAMHLLLVVISGALALFSFVFSKN